MATLTSPGLYCCLQLAVEALSLTDIPLIEAAQSRDRNTLRGVTASQRCQRNSGGASVPCTTLHRPSGSDSGSSPSGTSTSGTMPTLLMSVPAGVWYLRRVQTCVRHECRPLYLVSTVSNSMALYIALKP